MKTIADYFPKRPITADEVRREIARAIEAGLANPDPSVRAEWNKIPREGAEPTPEEVIVIWPQR